MNKEFLSKQTAMRKNLQLELQYSLPTVRLLENVDTAFFQFPDSRVVVLKNRIGGPLNKVGAVVFDNYNASEKEIQALSRKVVEIKFSGFNKRGQDAILDYMAAMHREQMKAILEGKVTQKTAEPKVEQNKEEKQRDPFSGGRIFGEQSPEDFFQKAIRMGAPFITSHHPGSGKTAIMTDLVRSIPSLISSLSENAMKAGGSEFSTPNTDLMEFLKSKQKKDLNVSDVSKSSSLYLDCNLLAELSNGQVKFIKSRGGIKTFSPEMEFLVLTDLSQLEFYPKEFFKGKNVLIVK